MISFIIGMMLLASGTDSTSRRPLNLIEPDPTCGVYAVYAAARYFNIEIKFNDLLNDNYVSSLRGSSFADLESACHRARLECRAFINLSSGDLRNGHGLFIMHVRGSPWSIDYDHYVLLFNVSGDTATIMDTGRMYQLSFAKLLQRWSGNGLVLDALPIRTLDLYKSSLVNFFTVCLCAITVICLIHALGCENWLNRVPTYARRMMSAAILILTAAALSLSYHKYADRGLRRDPDTVREVELWHTDKFIVAIKQEELHKLVSSGRVHVVDARSSAQFVAGHISGALSIPWTGSVNVAPSALRELLRDDLPTVVYCEQSDCRASSLLARALTINKITKVRVYKEGWSEWKATARERSFRAKERSEAF